MFIIFCHSFCLSKLFEMTKFTEGKKKGVARVVLFPNGTVFLNSGKPVVNFTKNFTTNFYGQIAFILKAKKYILYTQDQQGMAEQSLICILGTTTFQTFNDARAEFTGEILAKVCGDVFTLPYMSEDSVKDFITQVCALTTVDANMPNKDEYAKYNIVPVFTEADFTSVVPTSKVVEPTQKLGFTADSGAAGWAPLKSVPTSNPEKKKTGLVLSDEANGKIDIRVANVSLKKETVAALELKLSELQKELALAKEQVTKAESLLEATRASEIAKAVAVEAARALEDLADDDVAAM
jgi:hypothetical protein